jgi:hypothetical protein
VLSLSRRRRNCDTGESSEPAVTVGERYSSIDWGGAEWLLHTGDLEPLALAVSEALERQRGEEQ